MPKPVYIIGIYQIRNLSDGKIYVGQSMHLDARKRRHFWELRNNRHSNKHLQSAYNLYGKENFAFEILLYCEEFELTRYEDGIKNSNQDHCYNIRIVADSNKGLKHTDEYKRNASEAKKGNKNPNFGKTFSQEYRNNISEGQKGKKVSEEGRHNMSIARKGKKRPEFSGENNPMFGKTHTDNAKQKISDTNSDGRMAGENNPMYGKDRSGENNPMFGRKHSEKTKAEFSKQRKGKMTGESNSMSKTNREKRRLEKKNKEKEEQ